MASRTTVHMLQASMQVKDEREETKIFMSRQRREAGSQSSKWEVMCFVIGDTTERHVFKAQLPNTEVIVTWATFADKDSCTCTTKSGVSLSVNYST